MELNYIPSTTKSCPQIIKLNYPTSVSDLTDQKRTCASCVSRKWDKKKQWATCSGTGSERAMGAEWWLFPKMQETLQQLLWPWLLKPITLTEQPLLCTAPLSVPLPWKAFLSKSLIPHVNGDSTINCTVISYSGNVNSRVFQQWLGTVWLMCSSWWGWIKPINVFLSLQGDLPSRF